MLHAVMDWFRNYKLLIASIACIALLAGIVVPVLCYLYPSVLAGIIAFNIFSWLPFAFVANLHMAFALPVLGLTFSGIAAVLCAATTFICGQIKSIGQHVIALCFSDRSDPSFTNTSSPYVHKHLRAKSKYLYPDGLEDDDELQPAQELVTTIVSDDACSTKDEINQSDVKVENASTLSI